MNKLNTSKKIFLIILAVIFVLAGWFLYHNYLKTINNLMDFLPNATQFSLLNSASNNLLVTDKTGKIITDNLFNTKGLTQQLFNDANQYLPSARQSLLFFVDENKAGLILTLPKNQIKNFKKENRKNVVVLNSETIAFVSSPELITLITNDDKEIKKVENYLLTDNSKQWQIRWNKGFLTANYQNLELLKLWQNILQPLKNSQALDYLLSAETGSDYLSLTLAPQTVAPKQMSLETTPSLNNLLDNIPATFTNILALEDNSSLPTNDQAWQTIANQIQIANEAKSSPELLKVLSSITAPLVFAWNQDKWWVATTPDNLSILKKHLQIYFGKNDPKEKAKQLPDGSWATELLSNPDKISFTETADKGWRVFTPTFAPINFGLAQKENLVLGSNNLSLKTEIPNKLNNNCLNRDSWQKDNDLSSFLNLNQDFIKTVFPKNLDFLSKITASTRKDGAMRLCLYF